MAKKGQNTGRYHHGDLRASLVDAGVELLQEKGVAGLSLRECARRAGVSHTAPYRHFADKDALLLEIVRRGFEGLREAGATAMEGIQDPRRRLDAYGAAYVRFAIEHPALHRLMFTSDIRVQHKPKVSQEEPAFALLVEAAAAVVGPDADPVEAAAAFWALPHGLSMLILDGRIPEEAVPDADAAEKLAHRVFDLWRRSQAPS